MASEGKLRIAQDRGAKAKALLDNELLQEAFAKIEASLLEDWKTTSSEDAQRREDAWRSFRLLKNLQGHLTKIVAEGSAASKELLQIKDPSIIQRLRK